MKWNLWLSFVTIISVYLALAIPLFMKIKGYPVQYTAPPGAAFLLAIPYAISSGIVVFIVCWLLQTQMKI